MLLIEEQPRKALIATEMMSEGRLARTVMVARKAPPGRMALMPVTVPPVQMDTALAIATVEEMQQGF